MSFNRRYDRRPDRPPQQRRSGGGEWQPRERSADWQPRERGGEWQPRDRGAERGSDRPHGQRPRQDRPYDEGGMSLRLDPRRLSALKALAGVAGMRPGDLVRQWVEERIDAERRGTGAPAVGGDGLVARVDELAARIAALEAALIAAESAPEVETPPIEADEAPAAEQPAAEAPASAADEPADEPATEPAPAPARRGRPRKNAVSATPSTERVALHDEMIAVIRERGPMPAAELASAIVERGRYAPPRSGKPLDAAMVSQRVSNPTYRARFTRVDGRIGLAD